MNVVPIESSKSFKFHGPRADQQPPERPVNDKPNHLLRAVSDYSFVPLAIALTAWLPTGLWCAELQNPLPAFLVAISELIGSVIGIAIYRIGPPAPQPCAPVTMVPDKEPAVASYRRAA